MKNCSWALIVMCAAALDATSGATVGRLKCLVKDVSHVLVHLKGLRGPGVAEAELRALAAEMLPNVVDHHCGGCSNCRAEVCRRRQLRAENPAWSEEGVVRCIWRTEFFF